MMGRREGRQKRWRGRRAEGKGAEGKGAAKMAGMTGRNDGQKGRGQG